MTVAVEAFTHHIVHGDYRPGTAVGTPDEGMIWHCGCCGRWWPINTVVPANCTPRQESRPNGLEGFVAPGVVGNGGGDS